ncbi:uncharacterized protein K02A2.6-like [Leguminivora glycinivorella]|uniref:uncharacterized protein K02A2.6-like n=1 Tax=Leguminivora glycinivorella TaxID=1035111 RepID=UPI00200EFEE8|nr:uncharacterized protein K02A2.6-like [Leguminivora glycinivorella]
MGVGKIPEFDVKTGNWTMYCERLEMYFLANDIKEEVKLPTLIAVMGEDAYHFLSTHESLFDGTLGRYTGGSVRLHVREGAGPVFCRARPVPFALRPRVDAELDAMLEAGVIWPVSRSDWATPLVIARKADGGIRLCADYKIKKG